MKNKKDYLILFMLALCCFTQIRAQQRRDFEQYRNKIDNQLEIKLDQNYEKIKFSFEKAYQQFPTIPKGILEAISFTYTRFYGSKQIDTLEVDENSMPRTYTIMGMTLHGKGVFRENLRYISKLSGISTSDIIFNTDSAVIAYASAFFALQNKYNCFGDSVEKYRHILIDLCELPLQNDDRQDFATNSYLYSIYYFLNSALSTKCGAPARVIDMKKVFGDEYEKVSSGLIQIEKATNTESDYEGALYVPAASCNYSSGRGGVSISSVTIHYTQGSYAGSIAWFQNCSAKVSSHYIIRSIDGQVTQMVKENDKAWHVGSANGYTIGIEHEAFGDIQSYFTSAMYQSSAALVRNICSRRNLNPHRVFYRDTLDNGSVLNYGVHNLGGATACTQIRGHQHYPSQTHTDPGQFWNWNLYYKLINPNPIVDINTNATGEFTDSGGINGDYCNDERKLFLIHVEGADSIALTFNEFELEADYDFLWIYEGDSEFDKIIGRWNTQSPGRVVCSGDKMLIEFRSDCATTAAGWHANWESYFSQIPNIVNEELADDNDEIPNDNTNPQTIIEFDASNWVTKDFTVNFTDSDNSGIKWRFYQIMEHNGSTWSANHKHGFICDNFDYNINDEIWSNNSGTPWQILNGTLHQSNNSAAYSAISANINGTIHNCYLFDFYLQFNTDGKCSFFFNCNENPTTQISNGYEVCFDKTAKSLSIFRHSDGTTHLLKKKDNIAFLSGTNYLYRIVFDRTTGEILIMRHGNKLLKITDDMVNTQQNSFIGFATKKASVSIDNLRVYGSRGTSVAISVGAADTCKIHNQSNNGASVTKLKSIVVDKAYNFSTLAEKNLKVDFTKPAKINNLNVYISTATAANGTPTKYISATWNPSSDQHSGIKKYHFKNVADVVNSNFNNFDSGGTSTQCLNCYKIKSATINFTVVAENNAGLFSEPTTLSIVSRDNKMDTPIPILVTIKGSKILISASSELSGKQLQYTLYDITGRKISSGTFANNTEISDRKITNGIYILQIFDSTSALLNEKITICN